MWHIGKWTVSVFASVAAGFSASVRGDLRTDCNVKYIIPGLGALGTLATGGVAHREVDCFVFASVAAGFSASVQGDLRTDCNVKYIIPGLGEFGDRWCGT